MHPILFRLGSFEVHTYGVLVATGFLLGILTAAARAKREGIAPALVSDLGVWLIIAGMAGGKLFHIIFFWHDFIQGWRDSGVASLREGFVFYGGFICAALAAVIYTRVKHLPLAKIADAGAPSVALGHFFGRLGCFFEGCCYGKPCPLPWAVKFPPPHLLAGVPLHPTELYEAAGNLVIFAGLAAFYRHKHADGQVWWLYVLSYGVLRFIVEFYRGDYDVHYFGTFTIAHFLAAGMIAAALVGLKLCRRTA
ncbi:MAG TPA: prolipoprotein diacylglyceryl transferase [Verrucomicrobiae bacterium]|nr:prolipoprotein diacylglyceryl transferase [Verrucomicrobiae bacterium]